MIDAKFLDRCQPCLQDAAPVSNCGTMPTLPSERDSPSRIICGGCVRGTRQRKRFFWLAARLPFPRECRPWQRRSAGSAVSRAGTIAQRTLAAAPPRLCASAASALAGARRRRGDRERGRCDRPRRYRLGCEGASGRSGKYITLPVERGPARRSASGHKTAAPGNGGGFCWRRMPATGRPLPPASWRC